MNKCHHCPPGETESAFFIHRYTLEQTKIIKGGCQASLSVTTSLLATGGSCFPRSVTIVYPIHKIVSLSPEHLLAPLSLGKHVI